MRKIIIEGLKCSSCAHLVEAVLCRLERTEDVRVDLDESYVELIGSVSDEEIIAKISELGYKVLKIEKL
jgi:copper chaperone CopZ